MRPAVLGGALPRLCLLAVILKLIFLSLGISDPAPCCFKDRPMFSGPAQDRRGPGATGEVLRVATGHRAGCMLLGNHTWHG